MRGQYPRTKLCFVLVVPEWSDARFGWRSPLWPDPDDPTDPWELYDTLDDCIGDTVDMTLMHLDEVFGTASAHDFGVPDDNGVRWPTW